MPEPAESTATQMPVPRHQSGWWRAAALALWLAPLLVISITIIAKPGRRSVTPLYHEAVESWWNREPLYKGPAGMNYLPHFAVLFSPYHLGGRVVGDLLWRWTAAAGLAAGLWLFCGAISPNDRMRAFLVASLIAMLIGLPALQNGQANAHFGAALLLAAWCLKSQRWGLAAALLWLATAIKPLGIAAIGLALAAYPQLWWRLAIGLPAFVALPFLFAPADYAWSQCLAVRQNLAECSALTENRFADLNGLLRVFGAELAGAGALAVRALAGAVFMVFCWLFVRREREPARALLWLSAAAGFLMLFNPMNEANSYVILAPALGLMAWRELAHGSRQAGWLFTGLGLAMGVLPEPLQHVFGNKFSIVTFPPMTIVFLGVLAWQLVKRGAGRDRMADRIHHRTCW